ncbi:MAG: carboxypeptidase, partial [Candidatus Aminicenantes bacterium]|nr:carboxypeptidase [Candidatus Aminicenantes bacterium]
LENTGWLPTNGSQKALDREVVSGVTAELDLPPEARIVEGDLRKTMGQLAGRSEQRSIATWWGYVPGTPDRAVIDWVVAAPEGTALSVTARHERAGTARSTLILSLASPSS